MDEKARCQSCGMPLDASFSNFGPDSHGLPIQEYCMFCYQNGEFTNPKQTVDEMVQSSIDFMTKEFDMPVEQASQMSNDVIRRLERWN